MMAKHLHVLNYVAANGPCSCIEIMRSTGLERKEVYPFLYKARCYGGGKGWIDNVKTILPKSLTAPGEYTITVKGLAELATQEND